MLDANNKDFAELIEHLVAEASSAIDSALMSDEFLLAVDQSLVQIPNTTGEQPPTEQHANTSDTS
jgi:predicted RNase H-like nuclease